MTGTSRALKRLGVAGLSAVLMTTGLAAFAATAANAANENSQATSVVLTPPSDTATVDTCNPFTATVSPSPGAGNNYTVTVTISQPANKTTTGGLPDSTTIGFCDVSQFQPSPGANPSPPPAGTATPGPNTTSGTGFTILPTSSGQSCTGTSTSATSPGTLTCTTVYTTDSNGQVTFGVTSDTSGTMNVQAGVDVNQNGGVDTFEPQDSSTKTWVPNTPATGNGAINCKPTDQTAAASSGATATFTCNVTTAQGTPATGQKVRYFIQSGPDASNTAFGPCTETNPPGSSPDSGQYGQYLCTVTNHGVTGIDHILAFVDENNNSVVDAGEPQQSGITVDWVAPAPTNATVTLTCSPNQTNTAGTICQDDPTRDKTATFTATVTNNNTSPASPVAGAVVNFTPTDNSGAKADSGDTESLSASSCATGSNGQCTVTFTDSSPTDGESFTVTASAPLFSGGPATASATKNFHTPTVDEARNITVTPKHGQQVPGGAQTFTAKVTDRFGNPVSGVFVDWSETGPGGFRGPTFCKTDATGTCTVDVTSVSTERGLETVTGTIDATGASSECSSPAGYSNYNANGASAPGGSTPNTGGQNNVAPNAPAGNCLDSGTVDWEPQAAPPPPPTSHRTQISAVINCVSHHRHHVLKCKVHEVPKKAGLLVIFKRRHHHHHHHIGHDWTNANGVAILKLHHLHKGSVWRVFAHVKATSTTRGATTDTTRTTIK